MTTCHVDLHLGSHGSRNSWTHPRADWPSNHQHQEAQPLRSVEAYFVQLKPRTGTQRRHIPLASVNRQTVAALAN